MSKEHRLDYELDDRIEEALITGHAGVPLVIELFRASGAAGVMDAQSSAQAAGARPERVADGREPVCALERRAGSGARTSSSW